MRWNRSGLAAVMVIATVTWSRTPSLTIASAADDTPPIPVIVDYSPTMSDVTALLFLAQHPGVEILAVTIPGTGESRCGPTVANTTALLELVGRRTVPVACGQEEPLGPGATWPDPWRDAADALDGLELGATADPDPGSAGVEDGAELLAATVAASDQPVTVVALGPLTNLAAALDAHPEIVDGIARLYTMGGAFDVAGNGENGVAEWNYVVDPVAVDRVLGAGIPITMVPLDATNDVPVTAEWFERLAADHTTPAATAVYDLMAAGRPFEIGFFFWDELTAAAVVDPTVVSVEEQLVVVETSGVQAGRTITDERGVPVSVAVGADAERFEDTLLTTLNSGGAAPVSVVATAAEIEYFGALEPAAVILQTELTALFDSPEAQATGAIIESDAPLGTDDEATLRDFLRAFWSGAGNALETHLATVSALETPGSVAAVHDDYVDAIEHVLATQEARVSALDDLVGAELLAHFDTTDPHIDRLETTCGALAARADELGIEVDLCLN